MDEMQLAGDAQCSRPWHAIGAILEELVAPHRPRAAVLCSRRAVSSQQLAHGMIGMAVSGLAAS